ncbi:uncharacterized protein WM294_007180 [Sarcoramphus papa]
MLGEHKAAFCQAKGFTDPVLYWIFPTDTPRQTKGLYGPSEAAEVAAVASDPRVTCKALLLGRMQQNNVILVCAHLNQCPESFLPPVQHVPCTSSQRAIFISEQQLVIILLKDNRLCQLYQGLF